MKMTIRRMQLIDKYAGIAVCLVLSVAERLGRLCRGGRESCNIKKVLLLKFWGMGTIIVASPSIRRLREQYPGAQITFLTFENNTDIVRMLGIADRVIGIGIRNGLCRFVGDAVRAIVALRRERFDVLYDLEFFTRFSAIVSYLSAARERIGFHSWEVWRGALHTRNVFFNRYWHMGENFQNLLGVTGTGGHEKCAISIPAPAVEYVHRLLEERSIPRDRYVCVNVNAAVEFGWERRWEGGRFAALADLMADKYGVHAVFIGSAQEKPYVQSVIARGRRQPCMHDFSGLTESAQLAALLKESRMMVSNDTGPLHLAAALGVPTVSFFGSDTPVLYGPRGENHLVFYRNIDCSPCVSVMVSKEINCHKGFPQCLEEITVEDVFEGICKKGILRAI